MRRLGFVTALALLAVAAAALALAPAKAARPVPPLPPVMLWAWERPEDLRFVPPERAGVAFLARTIILHGSTVTDRPRLQPLRFHPRATLVAVVRVETDPGLRSAGVSPASANAPALAGKMPALQRAQVVSLLERTAALPGIVALQVDFDAAASERQFYRAVLQELRRRVALRLSITALASWCMGDRWLAELPVDEAVPMLFRMGPDGGPVRAALARGEDFPEPKCRGALGISTDEPQAPVPVGRQVYVFHPRAWTETAWRKVRP